LRLLVILMTFLLFVGFIGFVMTNLDTRVPVTVWKTQHPDLPLFLVVIVAILAGICYAGIIGVAEGASVRLENRKLRLEARRLETELRYVRTQPASGPRTEPDTVQDATEGASAAAPSGSGPKERSVPSAPVYGSEDGEWSSDDDEDVYSGGRAV
jgi:uncharacterized integral membrane protein